MWMFGMDSIPALLNWPIPRRRRRRIPSGRRANPQPPRRLGGRGPICAPDLDGFRARADLLFVFAGVRGEVTLGSSARKVAVDPTKVLVSPVLTKRTILRFRPSCASAFEKSRLSINVEGRRWNSRPPGRS